MSSKYTDSADWQDLPKGPFDRPEDADPRHPWYKKENFYYDPKLKLHKIVVGKRYRGKNGEVREVTKIWHSTTPLDVGYGLKSGEPNNQSDIVHYRVVDGRPNRVGKIGQMFKEDFAKWFIDMIHDPSKTPMMAPRPKRYCTECNWKRNDMLQRVEWHKEDPANYVLDFDEKDIPPEVSPGEMVPNYGKEYPEWVPQSWTCSKCHRSMMYIPEIEERNSIIERAEKGRSVQVELSLSEISSILSTASIARGETDESEEMKALLDRLRDLYNRELDKVKTPMMAPSSSKTIDLDEVLDKLDLEVRMKEAEEKAREVLRAVVEDEGGCRDWFVARMDNRRRGRRLEVANKALDGRTPPSQWHSDEDILEAQLVANEAVWLLANRCQVELPVGYKAIMERVEITNDQLREYDILLNKRAKTPMLSPPIQYCNALDLMEAEKWV